MGIRTKSLSILSMCLALARNERPQFLGKYTCLYTLSMVIADSIKYSSTAGASYSMAPCSSLPFKPLIGTFGECDFRFHGCYYITNPIF